MNALQRFLMWCMPGSWGEAMREESLHWLLRCPNCGLERSVWELGGIRWKAKGQPKRLLFCSQCGQRGLHEMWYKAKTRDR
ncbi:MAG: hypothetical protein KJ063_18780 [Anaerolineae bacterium]|nr:hypothetical protein [Anaerolineae bacterium]